MLLRDILCVQITGAQTHDSKVVVEMLELLNKEEISRFVGDRGYDTDRIVYDLIYQTGHVYDHIDDYI